MDVVARRAARDRGDLLAVLDRSNTNPLCPDCDYRTVAVSASTCACERCGQIVVVATRAAAVIRHRFDGRTVLLLEGD